VENAREKVLECRGSHFHYSVRTLY